MEGEEALVAFLLETMERVIEWLRETRSVVTLWMNERVRGILARKQVCWGKDWEEALDHGPDVLAKAPKYAIP